MKALSVAFLIEQEVFFVEVKNSTEMILFFTCCKCFRKITKESH